MATVDRQLGAVARPAQGHVVPMLPKTSSRKLLERAIQAVCERRDPNDLATIDDPRVFAADARRDGSPANGLNWL
nr:hypothetical protein [uncultured Noviherbaspirillum sp.]